MKVLRRLMILAVVVSGVLWHPDSHGAQPNDPGKAIGLEGRAIARTSEGGRRWVLIVGISDYHNVPGLEFTRQDFRAFEVAREFDSAVKGK